MAGSEKQRRRGSPGVGRLTGGVFLVVTALGSIAHLRNDWAGPRDLQPVAATLESGHCEDRLKRVSKGGSYATYEWHPIIRYRYTVNGQTYQGQQFAPNERSAFSLREHCQADLDQRMKPGGAQAWVSAADPNYAVLDPALPSETLEYWLIGIGATSALWGVWINFKGRSQRRVPQPQ